MILVFGFAEALAKKEKRNRKVFFYKLKRDNIKPEPTQPSYLILHYFCLAQKKGKGIFLFLPY